MSESSKDLLQLETQSSLESKLLVCNKNRLPENPVQRPPMFPVPKSQVLGKVKDFLGVMAESNKKLMEEAKNNPGSHDIEVLSGKESEYIEMDLMLGVADLHTPEAIAAAESALAGKPPAFPFAESSSGSETDDSSDEDEEEDRDNDGKGEAPSKSGADDVAKDSSCNPSKKQNPKKRPRIVELS